MCPCYPDVLEFECGPGKETVPAVVGELVDNGYLGGWS